MDLHHDNNKRITVNLPEKLLKEAQICTGNNMTNTIVEGLKLVKKSRAYELGMKLKGKIKLNIDLDTLRERSR